MTTITTEGSARSEGGPRGGGSGAVRRCRTVSGDSLSLHLLALEGGL